MVRAMTVLCLALRCNTYSYFWSYSWWKFTGAQCVARNRGNTLVSANKPYRSPQESSDSSHPLHNHTHTHTHTHENHQFSHNHPLLIDSILKSSDTRAQSVLVNIVAFIDRDTMNLLTTCEGEGYSSLVKVPCNTATDSRTSTKCQKLDGYIHAHCESGHLFDRA